VRKNENKKVEKKGRLGRGGKKEGKRREKRREEMRESR
jgi:hypothetical protein